MPPSSGARAAVTLLAVAFPRRSPAAVRLLTLVLCLAAGAARAQPQMRVEAVGGVDTNVTRAETDAPRAGGLTRLVVDLADARRPGGGVVLTGAWHAGVRHFLAESNAGEDALLQRLDGAAWWSTARWLRVGVQGGLRDRATRDPENPRDGTQLRLTVPLVLRVSGFSAQAGPVLDRFHYKPDPDLDADGVGLAGRLAWTASGFEAGVSGEWLARTYRGVLASGEARADRLGRLGVGLAYDGAIIARLDYQLLANDSTDVEGEYLRHVVTATATVPLPWQIVLSARLTAQRILHAEAQYLADDRLLDDEGRSALTLRVERPLGERWSVVVHGGVWASPFASGPDFSRQLALAGFSYSVAD